MNSLLEEGRLLPLAEDFYTLQGEGYHTGKAAWFIRLGGCDVGCSWCDSKFTWNPAVFPPVPVAEIIARAVTCPARAVVITGGEPLHYPLDLLCKGLKQAGMEIFLETSGSRPLSGQMDWICLSPKQNHPPLPEFYHLADELKVIITGPLDLEWAEFNRRKVRPECRLYLQPEWSRREAVMPHIVSYIKANPVWNISLQSHKYINIP
ncbi:MAG: 7-carboxy-7-deazaguanine synthase QueE [Bacteroidales bacterium]|jgi:organic radical activating enzyme|nr:7-carboxy-7-deazaguanine synthase QueE [Bacteroidales bacterium]MDD2824250.1 7-carboxy-7-deazaguanine synthase QueE [Bacteroidales bacterium]MDD3100137.1 7-carboxy-7-deazaguanine synthase QueE [Bacteroidales bacterium]MDD3639276.1 7-carboxy-7-deazaguanine synthase QueE [Bacteroidales bacterium]MDD3943996.1 7-carboxy-7-deazaguanine synthase QueE [Bacteroidales bacterium]